MALQRTFPAVAAERLARNGKLLQGRKFKSVAEEKRASQGKPVLHLFFLGLTSPC
jgi:hypothetical protein